VCEIMPMPNDGVVAPSCVSSACSHIDGSRDGVLRCCVGNLEGEAGVRVAEGSDSGSELVVLPTATKLMRRRIVGGVESRAIIRARLPESWPRLKYSSIRLIY